MATPFLYFTTHQDYEELKGFDVLTADHEKLGSIEEVYHPPAIVGRSSCSRSFRVSPGILRKLFTDQDDVLVSESVIRRVYHAEEVIVLDVPMRSLGDGDGE